MINEQISIFEEILGKARYPRFGGEEYLFFCPAHEHHKPKLSVNFEKNVSKCWICDERFKNLKYFVKKYGTKQNLEEWNKISGIVDFSAFEEQQEPKEKISLPEEYEPLINSTNIGSYRAQKILKDKNVLDKILLYKIGMCKTGKYKERIIIPSFDINGKLNYFVGRTYSKNASTKYIGPSLESNVIFNDYLIDWSKPVILVENVFDSMLIENSIPLLGSKLKEGSLLHSKICELSKEVIVSLDKDAEKKEDRLIKELHEYGVNVYFVNKQKEFSEMSKEEIKKLFDEKQLDTFEHMFMKKLQKAL